MSAITIAPGKEMEEVKETEKDEKEKPADHSTVEIETTSASDTSASSTRLHSTLAKLRQEGCWCSYGRLLLIGIGLLLLLLTHLGVYFAARSPAHSQPPSPTTPQPSAALAFPEAKSLWPNRKPKAWIQIPTVTTGPRLLKPVTRKPKRVPISGPGLLIPKPVTRKPKTATESSFRLFEEYKPQPGEEVIDVGADLDVFRPVHRTQSPPTTPPIEVGDGSEWDWNSWPFPLETAKVLRPKGRPSEHIYAFSHIYEEVTTPTTPTWPTSYAPTSFTPKALATALPRAGEGGGKWDWSSWPFPLANPKTLVVRDEDGGKPEFVKAYSHIYEEVTTPAPKLDTAAPVDQILPPTNPQIMVVRDKDSGKTRFFKTYTDIYEDVTTPAPKLGDKPRLIKTFSYIYEEVPTPAPRLVASAPVGPTIALPVQSQRLLPKEPEDGNNIAGIVEVDAGLRPVTAASPLVNKNFDIVRRAEWDEEIIAPRGD